MHPKSKERFVCSLETREDGVIQYFNDGGRVAHLVTSMDDSHIKVWFHTPSRCSTNQCKKPVVNLRYDQTADKAPASDDPMSKLALSELLEGIFGPGELKDLGDGLGLAFMPKPKN